MTVEDFLAAPAAADGGGLAAPPPFGEHTLTLDAGWVDAPVDEDGCMVCADVRCSVGLDTPAAITLTFSTGAR